MIQSARQRRKKRQDLMGIVGIVALLVLAEADTIFFNQLMIQWMNLSAPLKMVQKLLPL